MKLAIIDLDGVIANADVRFAEAELVKEQWLMERQKGLPYANDKLTEKSAQDVYWRVVFNPENVVLDTLIEGAVDALLTLEKQEHTIYLLTSRPESMREATSDWLVKNKIAYSRDAYGRLLARGLIMKPPAFQYTKTVVWKAGTIQMLVAMYGADEVLVVDDEDANLAEIMKYDTSHWRLCKSLAEAIAPEPEPTSDDNPF